MDDWPLRVGIPVLRTMIGKIDWVASCLLDSFPSQKEARGHIDAAIASLKSAICSLARSRV